MTFDVGVVGAGSFGTVLAKILAENNKSTMIWSYEAEVCHEINSHHLNSRYLADVTLPTSIVATSKLDDLCKHCRFIFIAVPAQFFRTIVHELGEHLAGDFVIVHCTKGFEIERCQPMSQILREETCIRKIGVLSGPILARELAEQHPAGVVIASKYDEVVAKAQQLLHNSYFRAYGSHDLVGVEVGGAYKNIIAIAAGVIDGLGLGNNTKALLITRGLHEMMRLGEYFCVEPQTLSGLAGVGDVFATCNSIHSRNYQVGLRLVKGESLSAIEQSMTMIAEGIKTTLAIQQLATRTQLDLPIARAVHAVLYEGQSVPTVLKALMVRGFKREIA